jgi:hypothetical protein
MASDFMKIVVVFHSITAIIWIIGAVTNYVYQC